MVVINIVDSIEKINFGIWNAAIATAKVLFEKYQITSEIWYPQSTGVFNGNEYIKGRQLPDTGTKEVKKLVETLGLSPRNAIICTHGCWRFPTQWGNTFSKLTFKWIYCPHGMLEPWSLGEKRLKKWLYLNLVEKRLVRSAYAIRAVGSPEYTNLSTLFGGRKKVLLIPNGVESSDPGYKVQAIAPIKVIFLSRLHHKKGVLPLVEAWHLSSIFQDKRYHLIIAGPDQGELEKINTVLEKHKEAASNAAYIGAVYGEEKEKILLESTFFILPSQSEGFPTSILEAMRLGLIPIITEGCNFPELLKNKLGISITPDVAGIKNALDRLPEFPEEELLKLRSEIIQFVDANYSLDVIAQKQVDLFLEALNN